MMVGGEQVTWEESEKMAAYPLKEDQKI